MNRLPLNIQDPSCLYCAFLSNMYSMAEENDVKSIKEAAYQHYIDHHTSIDIS